MKGKQIKIRGEEGIYFLDDGSQVVEVDGDGYLLTNKFKKPYKLLIVITKVIDGKRKYKRKVLRFERTVSLRTALRTAIEERINILRSMGASVKERKNVSEIPTLNEALDLYLMKKTDIKEYTKQDMKCFYNKHIRPALGDKHIDKIESYEIQNLIDSLKLKGYAKRTTFKVIDVLNPLFKHYKLLRYVKENPLDYVKKDRKFDNEVEITLTDKEKKALVEAIKGYPLEPFRSIFTFLLTGRRLSEVLGLTWDDVFEEEGYYRIPKERSKSSKELIFPLTADLYDALTRQERKGKYVFPSVGDPNKQMDRGTLKRHWKHILKTAGIERLRIHDLRHMLGNTLIARGATLDEVAVLLGHSSLSVTKRYAKAELQTKRKILEKYKKMLSEEMLSED